MAGSGKLSKSGGTLAQARRHRQETWKYRPLVKRTYRLCLRVTVGVVLVLAALVVVAALRLMAGPVDLDFLKARITQAADVPGNDIRPDVDHHRKAEHRGRDRPRRRHAAAHLRRSELAVPGRGGRHPGRATPGRAKLQLTDRPT